MPSFDMYPALALQTPKFGEMYSKGLQLKGYKEDRERAEAERSKKLEKDIKYEEISGRYMGGDDEALSELAYDPEKAMKLYDLKQKVSGQEGVLEGTGLESQLINQRTKLYQKNEGLTREEAFQKATNDVLTRSEKYLGMSPEGYPMTEKSNPLSIIGKFKSADDIDVKDEAKFSMIADRARQIQEAPEEQRPDLYNQAVGELTENGDINGDGIPDAYGPEVSTFLDAIVSKAGGATQPEASVAPVKTKGLTPAERAAAGKKSAELAASKKDDIEKEAETAASDLEQGRLVYDIYNSGFEGGIISELEAKLNTLEGNIDPSSLNPSEQKLIRDYTALKQASGRGVLVDLGSFKGAISEGERKFAESLQAVPMNIKEQALVNQGVKDAVSHHKIRKNAIADAWSANMGLINKPAPAGVEVSFEDFDGREISAKTKKGESFAAFYNRVREENPIITPKYWSDRGLPAPVTNAAEVKALPRGAQFINPSDGKIYRKK